MIASIVCFLLSIPAVDILRSSALRKSKPHRWKHFILLSGLIGLFGQSCAVRNAEYDQLISGGDYVQAKSLIRGLLEELSFRDENPSMPARRAQLYYWLANAHGKLEEYDSLKLALSLSVSNDHRFDEARNQLLTEFSLLEYNKAVARYNEGVYDEAVVGWRNALDLIELVSPRPYEALTFRNLGFAEAGNKNTDRAVYYFTRATQVGDAAAQDILREFHEKGVVSMPTSLPPVTDLNALDLDPSPEPSPPAAFETSPPPQSSEQAVAVADTSTSDGLVRSYLINIAWTVQTVTSKDIERLPLRGPEQYLPFLNGINNVNNGFHVRGSRTGETGYLLDGISVLNPFYNTNDVPLIPEATEKLEIHTGAYGSSIGSMGGGMILSRMKTGGEELKVFLDIRGDDLAKPGTQFAGTTAFGHRTIVGTVDGPLPIVPGFRFFLAGEHYFTRNRDPMFLDPFRYDLVTDGRGSHPSGIPLPGPIEFKRNHLPNNWLERNTLQGNATFSLGGIDFKLIGSYSDQVNPEGGQWPLALRRYFVQKRNPLNKVTTRFGALSAGTQLGSDTRIEASVAFLDRYQRIYDPDFKHNFRAYTDSLANARLGYTGFNSRFEPPYSYSTIFAFFLDHPSTPSNSYSKENQFGWVLAGKVAHRILREWQIEAGANASLWTMRYYRITNIRSFRYGETFGFYPDDEYRRIWQIRSGGIKTAGYQYDNPSIEIDEGNDGPAEPVLGALYVQNYLNFEPALIDIGFRYEIVDPNLTVVPMTVNPSTGKADWQEMPFDDNLGILDESQLTKTSAFTYLLPRIGISFTFSERTKARIAYGMYAQLNRLSDLHMDNVSLSSRVNPLTRVPYNLGGSAATFLAEPERSRQFEVGLHHVLGSGISAGVVYYQKSLDNQLQLERVSNSQGNPIFVGVRNGGKGISTGIEFAVDASLGERFSAQFLYTWSETKGRLADLLDWRYVSDDAVPALSPEFLVPLAYDQTHRGTMVGTLTFGKDDGPVLEGTSLSTLFTFRSGQRYTALNAPVNLGAAGPWHIGVRQLVDPRSLSPVSAENEVTGPWYFNIDLRLRKSVSFSGVTLHCTLDILNLLNRRHVLNVFPTTGSPNTDGWLLSEFSEPFKTIPLYEEFYQVINLQNRWAYMGATGYDIYGTPRQVRVGVSVAY